MSLEPATDSRSEIGACTSAPQLSVIIVSYNTRDLLERCLATLTMALASTPAEVIVVDNASADGSAALVGGRFPAVQLIELRENIGFGRAVNTAATQARGSFLLLLNPDTEVLAGGVQDLLAFARAHPAHGLYGGRTVQPDGALDPRSCWGLPTAWSLFCFGTGLSSARPRSRLFNPEALGGWERDSVREVPALSGSFLLISRRVWEELGGFDASYFMYSEDIDLSLRARRSGYRPVFVPFATIVHHGGGSSPSKPAKMCLVMKGKATFVRRNSRGWRCHWGLAMLWLGAGVRGAAGPLLSAEQRATWADVWRQRRAWISGYPAGPSGDDGPGS